MTPRPIVIIGGGGHGREAYDIVTAINEMNPTFEVVGFIDDGRAPGELAAPHEVPVLGGVDYLRTLDVGYVPAIGAPDVRRRVVASLPNHEAVDLVHPAASVGSHVAHGPGLIVAAGGRITHAVILGSHVHVNVNASVSHDSRIGSFVTIAPGVHLSGGVTLGDCVWMGIGSSAIQGVIIGADVTVGAAAAVVDDLPDGCTAVGVPARPIRGQRKA
jgi:sugar O-acyltransferase (sialic acid O-acetyltransferase NeuD family)